MIKVSSSIGLYYVKRVNLETEVTRKQSSPNFPKNEHFSPPYNFFFSIIGKFGVLYFIVASVSPLPPYRHFALVLCQRTKAIPGVMS